MILSLTQGLCPFTLAGMQLIHATSVALGDRAVLIRGPSGSGKSDLALRLIDQGADLIADDQTGLLVRDGAVLAVAPPRIAGLLEVRGIGIVRRPWRDHVPVDLVVDLVPAQWVERLPDPRQESLCGLAVRAVSLHPFFASAPAQVRLLLSCAPGDMVGGE